MRRSIATLLAGAALALQAPALGAQVVHDEINVSATPDANFFDAPYSIGWFYTPGSSFALSQIFTQFHPGGANRTVSVDVYDATLANLLATDDFESDDATNQLGGAEFAPITLTQGTTYFIGFRGIFGLGLNVTADQGAEQLFPLRASFDPADPAYLEEIPLGDAEDRFFQPILQLSGPQSMSNVPEPASVALVATGMIGVLVAARRRRR